MKRLDRAVFKELAGPFAFGLAAFSAILLASTVLFELVRQMVSLGLAPLTALRLLALKLPGILGFGLPMGVLLGALLGYGRLSGDGELTAWRAMGVSPWRLCAPACAFGLLVAAGAWAVGDVLAPRAEAEAARLLAAVEARPAEHLGQRRNVLLTELAPDGRPRRLIYARSASAGKLSGAVVQDFDGSGALVRITQASRAAAEGPGRWRFERGQSYALDPAKGELAYAARFDTQVVDLGTLAGQVLTDARPAPERTAGELARHAAALAGTGAPRTQVAEWEIRAQERFSIPAASVAFALLGAPLGVGRVRGGAGLGMGLAVLWLFGYYVLMFLGLALAQLGVLPSWLGAWLPDLAVTALGALAVWRWNRGS